MRGPRLSWRDWNPGLDNDHLTLGQVLDALPAAQPADVPWIVRFFENPESRFALPGAISLARHDAVHVLLGRGLLPQDEAFVIGCTMGADDAIRPWHRLVFRFAARFLYPKYYRLTRQNLIAFDLGYNLGLEQPTRDFHDIDFEMRRHCVLRELRNELGLSVHRLQAVFRYEKSLLPATSASRRLDIDFGGVDHSTIYPPAEAS